MKLSRWLLLSLMTPLLVLGSCFATGEYDWVDPVDIPTDVLLNSQSEEDNTDYEELYNTCNYQYNTLVDSLTTQDYLMFNLMWIEDDTLYSVPLSNDIFLPNNRRAYVDSGVVMLTGIDKNKVFVDPESRDVINGAFFSYIFGIVFIFVCCLFAYYMKRFVLMFFNGRYK